SFEEWAGSRRGGAQAPISIVDDGTVSDDDKLGAIGDIKFVLDRESIDDDLLVVLGDNLFDLDVENLVAFFKNKGITVGAYDVRDKEAARLYGIVAVDGDSRVVDFLEKPPDPPSTLAAIGMYLYPREKLDLFRVYAEEGNKMDAPGYFVKWLYQREPVYAYAFNGVWYDIGDLEMYKKADELYAAKHKN
ncbi:MAG: sugar phosphate nucleotidyltransferase, partial [bacterium]